MIKLNVRSIGSDLIAIHINLLLVFPYVRHAVSLSKRSNMIINDLIVARSTVYWRIAAIGSC
ncbi:hypothetical protein OKW40_000824 [Paraburkholderia sp. RAU6.4a]|uniref:hypothetical protein n=1 Tax=Paraburkholderia sp. RAU6.4a TaxID=2991067 RepID=UPI003D1D5ADC